VDYIKRLEHLFPQYDFSMSIFKDIDTKIDVKCPIHGLFQKKPKYMLYGNHQGCIECGFLERKRKKTNNFNELKKRLNKVHNNKYSYERAKYKSNNIPIEIICPIHGSFKQRTDNHLQGQGCSKCGKVYSLLRRLCTTVAIYLALRAQCPRSMTRLHGLVAWPL